MYEYHIERTIEEMKFQANIHGAEIKGTSNEKKSDNKETPMFKDPSAYKDLTEEQKKELTQKMLSSHKKNVGVVSSEIGS